jgi:hypothetical protein
MVRRWSLIGHFLILYYPHVGGALCGLHNVSAATPPAAAGRCDNARCIEMQKVANRNFRDFGWEIALTPADFPLHGSSPYRGLHVRRWGLGFVHRSRAILSPRAKPLRCATFLSLYAVLMVGCAGGAALARGACGSGRRVGTGRRAGKNSGCSFGTIYWFYDPYEPRAPAH